MNEYTSTRRTNNRPQRDKEVVSICPIGTGGSISKRHLCLMNETIKKRFLLLFDQRNRLISQTSVNCFNLNDMMNTCTM